MRLCNKNLRKTLELVDVMNEIADAGDLAREDTGCGVLYGVLRDSAYKDQETRRSRTGGPYPQRLVGDGTRW